MFCVLQLFCWTQIEFNQLYTILQEQQDVNIEIVRNRGEHIKPQHGGFSTLLVGKKYYILFWSYSIACGPLHCCYKYKGTKMTTLLLKMQTCSKEKQALWDYHLLIGCHMNMI